MAKPCAKCKRLRVQLSFIFLGLILINFIIRLALQLEIKSVSDALLLPSLGVILCGLVTFIPKKNKT